jgi:hypothetical protein
VIGGSKAKTIVAINERKKPLDDVRFAAPFSRPSIARR